MGGKVIKNYPGVIYRRTFKKSPFRKYFEKLFTLRHKCKDDGIDLMQGLNILNLNSLYGVQIRKDINELQKSKSDYWMQTEYGENILDYCRLPKKYIFCKDEKRRGVR